MSWRDLLRTEGDSGTLPWTGGRSLCLNGQVWTIDGKPPRLLQFSSMELAGLAERTKQIYVDSVRDYAKFFGRSAAKLGHEDLRRWSKHLGARHFKAGRRCLSQHVSIGSKVRDPPSPEVHQLFAAVELDIVRSPAVAAS